MTWWMSAPYPAHCARCGSPEADVDIGLCYQCFAADRGTEQRPGPSVEDLCGPAHAPYSSDPNAPARLHRFCYCGKVEYDEPVDWKTTRQGEASHV